MILYLFGCNKFNFDPLAKGNIHHVIFTTALFLVTWTLMIGAVWGTKPVKVPREFEMTTYQIESVS